MNKLKRILCFIFAITIISVTAIEIGATEKILSELNENISIINFNDSKVYISDLVPEGDAGFLPHSETSNNSSQQIDTRAFDDPGERAEVHYLETSDGSDITAYKLYNWSDEQRYQVHLDEIVGAGFTDLIVSDYPTYAYNDIAHAWYGSTNYWIDMFSFDAFKDDIHTQGPYLQTAAEPNDIITYWNSDYTICYHSGIVVDVESNGNIICESKWDEYGLYIHDYTNVPKDYANEDRTLGYLRYYVNILIYKYTQDEHDLYMIEDNGEDGCVVGCKVSKNGIQCPHIIECTEDPEYIDGDATGHWVDCTCGCYSFFEEHSYNYLQLPPSNSNRLYYHKATCSVCTGTHYLAHNWVTVFGGGVECTDCGLESEFGGVEGIMSLSDEELSLLLSSMSEEELEAFIALLPEDALARVTAILPPVNDDELLTE